MPLLEGLIEPSSRAKVIARPTEASSRNVASASRNAIRWTPVAKSFSATATGFFRWARRELTAALFAGGVAAPLLAVFSGGVGGSFIARSVR